MRGPAAISAGLTLLLGVACLGALQPGYVTPDDPNQMLIASGHMGGGSPDSHLVFSNWLWGLGMAGLHRLTAGVAWYTLALVLIHLASAWAITWSALRLAGSPLGLLPLLTTWWGFEARFLVDLQFTHAAAAATVAGLALLAVATGPGQRRAAAAGVGLAWAGSLIRLEAFVLVGAIAAPVLAWRARGERRTRVALGALLALVALSVVVDRAAYRLDPDWAPYRALFPAMSAVMDGPLLAEGDPRFDAARTEALEAAGWTEREWRLVERFRFAEDPASFDEATLTEVADRLGTTRSPGAMLRLLWTQKSDLAFLPMVLLLTAIPLVRGQRRRSWTATVLAAASAAVATGLVGYLLWAERFPRHVRMSWTYAVAVAAALAAAAALGPEGSGGFRRRAAAVALAAAVASAALGSVLLLRDSGDNARDVAAHYEIEEALLQGREGPFYFNNLEYFRTFDPWRSPAGVPAPLVPIAGTLRTPLVRESLRSTGHDRLIPAIASGQVVVVGKEDFLELLREQIEVRQGTDATYRVLGTYGPPPTDGERDRRFRAVRYSSSPDREPGGGAGR